MQNNGSDTFGIPDRVAGCDPVNSNYKSNPNGIFLGYINYSCFALPKASPAIASQCVPFGFGSKNNPSGIPGTCSNLLGNAARNRIVGPSLFNLDLGVQELRAPKGLRELKLAVPRGVLQRLEPCKLRATVALLWCEPVAAA